MKAHHDRAEGQTPSKMSEKADEREMLLTFKHSIDGRGIVRWSPSSFKREECRLVLGEDLVPGRCHEFLFSYPTFCH